MLYYTVIFLIIAIIAAVLGFGLLAYAAATIAKILFFVFLVAFLFTLIKHLTRHGAHWVAMRRFHEERRFET